MEKTAPSSEVFRQFVENQVSKHMHYYFEHVPMVDDEIVTILKSHLLIEEQLIKLINIEIIRPEALADSRLSFHQLVCIAESMHWHSKDEWMWNSIRKLNKIRNSLSHELKPKSLERDIADFHCAIETKCPTEVKNRLRELDNTRLTMTIALLYSYISAYLEACMNSKAQEGNEQNKSV